MRCTVGPAHSQCWAAKPAAAVLQHVPARGGPFEHAAATQALRLRLAATLRALQNLTAEARRMARWLQRRMARWLQRHKAMAARHLRCPCAPARHLGATDSQKKADIDLVLRECYALEWDALKVDSS